MEIIIQVGIILRIPCIDSGEHILGYLPEFVEELGKNKSYSTYGMGSDFREQCGTLPEFFDSMYCNGPNG